MKITSGIAPYHKGAITMINGRYVMKQTTENNRLFSGLDLRKMLPNNNEQTADG